MSYDRDKKNTRSFLALIALSLTLMIAMFSSVPAIAEYNNLESEHSSLPYSELRSGFALFKLGRFTLAASKWQKNAALLLETPSSKNATSLHDNRRLVAIAYLLSTIAYERAGSTRAYDSWANASRFFLHSGTRWELEREKLRQGIQRDAAQLDLLSKHPELLQKLASDSPIGDDRLLLLEMEAVMKISQYSGPALDLQAIPLEVAEFGLQQSGPVRELEQINLSPSTTESTSFSQEKQVINDTKDRDQTLVDLHWNQRQIAKTIQENTFADRSVPAEEYAQRTEHRVQKAPHNRSRLENRRRLSATLPTAPRPLAARSVTGYGNSLSIPDRQLKYLQKKRNNTNNSSETLDQKSLNGFSNATIPPLDNKRASTIAPELISSNAPDKNGEIKNESSNSHSKALARKNAHQGIKGKQLYQMWFKHLEDGPRQEQLEDKSQAFASEESDQAGTATRLGRIKIPQSQTNRSGSGDQRAQGPLQAGAVLAPEDEGSTLAHSKLDILKQTLAADNQKRAEQIEPSIAKVGSISNDSVRNDSAKLDSIDPDSTERDSKLLDNTVRVFPLENDDEIYEIIDPISYE